MRIVIVGAGLVGLTCAILLCKAGYRVTVLERDAELREVSPNSPPPTGNLEPQVTGLISLRGTRKSM
jgi:2-polyprenyl-6-methoxyphenol hydroxylase-like FAD-dependent oxidoreductase